MTARINSRAKGLTAERAVARYFVEHGRPDAKRSVATGWSNGTTESSDVGDIIGVPGFAVQVKSLARRLEGKLLADTWREATAQAGALSTLTRIVCTPLIIEKRSGSADVGRWWLHTSSGIYARILLGRPALVLNLHLVRVELGDVIGDLVAWSKEIERQG